jgi:hypothetical protein
VARQAHIFPEAGNFSTDILVKCGFVLPLCSVITSCILVGMPKNSLNLCNWKCVICLYFQVARRRQKLLNYMLFLRVTPTLPNTFINLASPIVDVPYHTFLLATLIGLIPAAYVTVRVSF